MIPTWLAILCMAITFTQGFVTAGMIYRDTPFWDGVRAVCWFWRRRP